ncbi:MAG: hypothetical protein ACE5IE_02850 [Dehalococcoidia bacterium]
MEDKSPKTFTPSDVIAALFVYLPKEGFSNDPAKIHSTIAQLQKEAEYKYLLEDFEFLNYDPYPYSPLLGRILNRLQESRLLASLNPDYDMYVVSDESRKAIEEGILNRKLGDQKERLSQIALKLSAALL